jgi:hypothetical protein
MTPTLTTPDPAIFPEDVRRFAAERGVTQYLVPLYELAKRCFDGADVAVTQEYDCEIAGLGWIVFAPAVGDWDLDRYRASKERWYVGFREICPSDDSINTCSSDSDSSCRGLTALTSTFTDGSTTPD